MALPNPLEAFVWGPGGAAMTPDQIARQREIAAALLNRAGDTSPVEHWSQGAARVADALAGKFKESRLDKAEAANAATNTGITEAMLRGGTTGFPSAPAAPSGAGGTFTTAGGGATVGGGPAPDMSGNQIYSEFMDTVKAGGVTNPNALAAIAATGQRESRFSPGNVNRTWSDPSESGQAGTAGGIMSWRGPRYQALAATGDLSPAGQARYFLQEDPQLIAALNNAKSPEEAIGLMNNAWKFAGYNRAGGEAAARLQAARSYLPSFQGQSSPAVAANEAMATGQPIQTASLDPSIGMGQVGPVPAEYAATGLSPEQWQAMNAPDGAVPPAATVPMPAQAEGAGFQVGGPATTTDAGNRVVQALINPQSMTGGAPMPLQGGAQPQPALSQVAQAAPQEDLSQIPPMAGGTAGAIPAGQQGFNPAIIEALSNPAASEQTKRIAGILLQQQMQQSDPMRQLEMQKLQRDLNAAPERKTTTINGRLIDTQTGQEIASFPDQTKPTSDIQEYEYAKHRGYEGSFVDFQLAQKKAGATSVTTNVGEGDKFFDELDKAQAGIFGGLSETGVQGRSKLAQIDRLDTLLKASETGGLAMIKQAAGEWGIKTEGLSDIQAAQALINELVPQQRQPGSGPMSDADLALFKQSLPRLINQPGGNQTIIETMRGITQYQIQMGEIADSIADRAMTPAQGREAIRALPNPLADFGKAKQPTVIDGYTIEEVE